MRITKNIYYLMNKDIPVLEFHSTKGEFTGNVRFVQTEILGALPIGFKNIDAWISTRNAGKHNTHIKKILEKMDCKNSESFLQMTHAVSINDTFWVKSVAEEISWNDVSLYRNQFTKVISLLAFEGVGVQTKFSPTTPKYVTHSPELVAEGSFRRCFRKENRTGEFGSDIFLYKRGIEKMGHGDGVEHYGEVLASEIAKFLCPDNAVTYTLAEIGESKASCCNLFTNENIGLAPLYKFFDESNLTLDNAFQLYSELGNEQQFREMLMLDALVFNVDRHFGNLGVLFNNDTLEKIKIAPIYDLNWSLFPSFSVEELENDTVFGDKLVSQVPKMGEDFTHLGRLALNDCLKDKLKDLQDFAFSFRGNDEFPSQRVKLLERIVKKQATAILSKDKLYTKDVFISPELQKQEQLAEKALQAKSLVYDFSDILTNAGYDVSITADNSNAIVLVSPLDDFDMEAQIDFIKGTIIISYGMKQFDFAENNSKNKELQNTDLYSFYNTIKGQLEDYLSEKHKEYLLVFSDVFPLNPNLGLGNPFKT